MMVSASSTLVLAGGAAGLAIAWTSGSMFHSLAIVMLSVMGAVACAATESAKEAADEARWWSLQCRRFELHTTGGFLPMPSPSEVELPEEFSAWERLAGRLALRASPS